MRWTWSSVVRARMPRAVLISLGFHILVVAVLLNLIKLPAKSRDKRGEAVFVVLAKPEVRAPRGDQGTPDAAQSAKPAPRPSRSSPAERASRPQPPRVAAVPAPPAPVAAARTPAESPTPAPPRATTPSQPPAPDGIAEQRAAKPSEPASVAPAAPAAQTPAASSPASPQPPGPAHPSESRVAVARPATPDIRSLRRGAGGPGMPGGLGGGRGGIEGNPISLDDPDPKFAEYLARLRDMIESKMGFYPCIKNQQTRECEYKNTDLYLEFGILKNGQLQFIDFRRSSGFPAYDDNSATAVKLAAPFPAPPVSMLASMKQGSTGIAIVGHFIYTYEVTLRGVLR